MSQFAADLEKRVAKKLQENTDDEEGGVEEINDADNEFEEAGDVNLVQVNKREATSDYPATIAVLSPVVVALVSGLS